jgi:carbonic anhydrase/acetyltransferase-like protein (isoleucine patch superfamily)
MVEIMDNIVSFRGKSPKIDDTAFVDSSSKIIGEVTIGTNASIWTGAVLRADENQIVSRIFGS